MRYILDDSGYIYSVSCNPIECDSKGCTGYTGAVPEGYDSIELWATNANIRAYKIVDGNLVYDADRAAALEAEWNTAPKVATTDLIAYQDFTSESYTLAGQTRTTYTLNCAKEGYTLIGLLFIDASNNNIDTMKWSVYSHNVWIRCFNNGTSSVNFTLTVRALFMKNS